VQIGSTTGGNVARVTVRGCTLGDPLGSETNRYTLRTGADITSIKIMDNRLVPGTTATVLLQGTASERLFRDNVGYVTRNAGVTSVADGGTIAHGLAATPTKYGATTTTADEYVAITAVSSTTLTVALTKHDGTAGTTANVAWWSEV
jgi:hypothetical protein